MRGDLESATPQQLTRTGLVIRLRVRRSGLHIYRASLYFTCSWIGLCVRPSLLEGSRWRMVEVEKPSAAQ